MTDLTYEQNMTLAALRGRIADLLGVALNQRHVDTLLGEVNTLEKQIQAAQKPAELPSHPDQAPPPSTEITDSAPKLRRRRQPANPREKKSKE